MRVGDSRFFFLDDLIYSLGVQQNVVKGNVVPEPVISLGEPGSWDEILCYFTGLNARAAWDGNLESEERPELNTGLAKWDMDRILSVSLKRGYSEGYCMLPAVDIDEDCFPEISVNVELSGPAADIKIALLDETSMLIIPGFGYDDFKLNSDFSGKWDSHNLPSGSRVVPSFRITGEMTRLYAVELCSKG